VTLGKARNGGYWVSLKETDPLPNGGDERVREAHRESVQIVLDQLEHTRAEFGDEGFECGFHGDSRRSRIGGIGVMNRAFSSARSQTRFPALTRTKAPVLWMVPMIHFVQWQRR
jgi:hypothetical protein